MWNPFRAAREAAKADRQQLFDLVAGQHAQTMAALSSMNETAGKMADASKAQAESFTTYLSLFKAQSPPESRVMRDEDELRMQLERDGFPTNGTQEAQLQWVLDHSD